MKALMLHSENSAVGYYRIWQPAKYLKKSGWDVARIKDEFHVMPIDGEDSWESLGEGSDIIVAQRPEQTENVAMFMAMREHFNAPFVYEIDDNIYDVAESSTSYVYWHKDSPRIKIVNYLIENADAVTVTTEGLKETFSHLNKNIYVLPNCQDEDVWKVKPAKPNKHFTIGWAGSSTHYDDLKLIWRPLKRFLRNHKDARFLCIGLNADFLEGHPQVEINTDWVSIHDYPQRLADLNFDIGLVPLVNRPFNIGKSNIKWQEYSMVGTPTIASSVGEYAKLEHNKTLLLAKSDLEWEHYLEKLYDDAKLRETLASNGKQYVIKNCNIKNEVWRWNEAYREIIGKH